MKSTLMFSVLTLFSNMSFANPEEVLTACKSLVEHASKVELGQEYTTLTSKTSLYRQSDFNLSDNQARVRAIVSTIDEARYEYAFTVTYKNSSYQCSLSDMDRI